MTTTIFEKCSDLCSHKEHRFLYWLNEDEKSCIHDTGLNIIYQDGKMDLKSLIEDIGKLKKLHTALVSHFENNPKKDFFLRLSSLSPKDAYCYMTPGALDIDEDQTILTIKRDIEFLRSGTPSRGSAQSAADHCINVLCHSDRVYGKLQYEDPDRPDRLAVMLLDWQSANHLCETRCFVYKGKLLAISQYYCELSDCYTDTKQTYNNVIKFITSICEQLPKKDCVVDVDISDDNSIRIIEYNPFNSESDSCLYQWMTETGSNEMSLDRLMIKSQSDGDKYHIPFRFNKDGKLCEI